MCHVCEMSPLQMRQWYVALRRHACVPPVDDTPSTGVEENSDEYTDDSDNIQTQPGENAAAGVLSDDIPRSYLSITPSSGSEDEPLVDPRARRRAEAQARVAAAGAEENNFSKPPSAISACYDSNGGDEEAPTKINNLEGWKYVVKAWGTVKEESIRHCFHHVPIISKDQKILLDSLGHNAEVASALQVTYPS
ncbi:hypothetical protein BC939DRAFT_481942 [Gamsiella multidivaricata]|uniref:uncharacterized protein n=1 Tax=Gamsiella multidivaricata TaxID=101098 RepID=UPI00221FB236|nr:uncharacterized protein BC939DRAFT_481942 [Gamsiella multidivaricata]KAI7816507.1 hypothetical protein BC939DRAFT_481942 [Gamsiella multidivaricata]